MPDGFGLYVHVPWCRHVCPYCDFNVYASARPPEEDYTATLGRELETWAARPPFAGRRVQSVYVGGGTPSLFTPDAIARVLDGATRLFGLADDVEVTLEANPGTVTDGSLRGYRAAGVNRLSLGAQSFVPALLRTLGRDHGPSDTDAAVAAARSVGIDDVSLDLIFAVPGGTLADWHADLEHAVTLAPTHVSAYSLTFEQGTPFHAWRAAGRLRPADEDDESAMAEHAAARLASAGYARYEISSWARPGRAARHNQGYWDGSHYLGIGAGAHSFDAGPSAPRRWSNLRTPKAYAEAVERTGIAVADEHPLDTDEARGDFVFTGLRRVVGVDATGFADRFGLALADAFPHVPGLVREGLLEWTGARLRLSPRGLRFADTVAATFV